MRRLDAGPTAPVAAAVTFALIDVPYGAVRRYLAAGKPPPAVVDTFVEQTCECLLFSSRDDGGVRVGAPAVALG